MSNFIGPFEVSHQEWWSYNSRFRGENYTGPINGSCTVPYQYITIDKDSDCNLCICDAWLPISVGKVTNFNSIEDVFASDIARILQKDVTDKKFTYCAIKHCNVIERHITFDRTQLSINIDDSCNLACPSCRRSQYLYSEGPVYDERVKSVERILEWLEKYDKPIHITTSGNGDCLASHIMRPLLKNYRPKPTQTFTIFTNGLLIKKVLADAPVLANVTEYKISIDAGTAEVYEVVRRPGKFSVLLENFNWLKENAKHQRVVLSFVLQKKNWRDLPNFMALCKRYDFDGEVVPLDDWATWSRPGPQNEIDVFKKLYLYKPPSIILYLFQCKPLIFG